VSERADHDRYVRNEPQVDDAINAQMRRTSSHAAIANVTATAISDAAAVGGTYSQSEVNALRTELVAVNARLALTVAALNNALQVLRDAELIPAS
jgi:hypothetical protein